METRAEGKKNTEERLIEAAIELYAKKWYGTVSIAEICRQAGLSNGIYYKYFENKESLFRGILERVLEALRQTVASVEGRSPRERLAAFSSALLDFTAREPKLVSVFREGQYRFFEYERRLAEIYTRGLSAALGREIGMAEYLFALGGIRFCAVRSSLQGSHIDPKAVEEILEGGLFPGLGFDPERVFGGEVSPPPIELSPGAAERLLKAGKRLFGEQGYFETNIHEITDAAGLSVGAFYTHFESKEAFYARLIALSGREVRSFIARNLDKGLNRLERELRGIWLFLVYLSIDKHCYAIVREAEFVLPEAVKDYYGAFVSGYRKNSEGNGRLDGRGEAEANTAIEFLLGLAHYFGIEVAFDESPGNARAIVESIGSYLAEGFSAYLG